MEPIRILQVVTLMNRGGLESMLMNYYRNIDRSKIQFDFLEHRTGNHDFTEEILSLGGRIFTVPEVNPLNTNGYLNKLDMFFESHKEYKIVHSHLDCMSAYPLMYTEKHNIPIRIAHSHNTNQERNWKYLVKKFSKKLIPKYANNLFACGEEAGNWMFGNNSFQILNNAIDAEKFKTDEITRVKIRDELDLNDEFVIGHVGRFNSQKNHKFLIEVFRELIKEIPNSKLLLIGVGELENDIRDLVDRYKINENVLFLGLRNDIHRIMQALDIFVFPSLFEGLPVTLIEAQASGVRCIVSDTVSSESFITKNIKTVSLNEKATLWAKEIIEYGRSYMREDTSSDIRESGYDIRTNAQWLEEFYINEYNKIR
ncbi:glycosyltransferase [Bacillus sp. MKU004]|nr:glycosyltransferase [Bacillus sp. MKU004]